MLKLKILKYSLLSLFISTNLFAEQIDSVVDIEVNKLNQILKKEVELVNMIESYILLMAPHSDIDNDGIQEFDSSKVTISEIQKLYNLPNSYFTNYSNEECIPSGNYCSNVGNKGINIKLENGIITISNLLGETNERNVQLFKRLHKKYKFVIFDNDYKNGGTIKRSYSNKINNLISNLNTYLINPYKKDNDSNYSIISYKKPPSRPKIWVKPNGEGSFYTYAWDQSLKDGLGDYKLVGKNIITQYPTFSDYAELQKVNTFDGAIMYARYKNMDSNYSKHGEMEFINYNNKWAIIAGNNIFIKDQVSVVNNCSEIRNSIVGLDKNERYAIKGSSENQSLGDKFSISFSPNKNVINNEQLFYFFRSEYELKIDPNSPLSPKIKLNYDKPNIYDKPGQISPFNYEIKWSADLLRNGGKKPKNNYLSFEVYNKLTNKLENITKIEINEVKFYDGNYWFVKNPINNIITGDNLREIKLDFKEEDKIELKNKFISKYKAEGIPSGTIIGKSIVDLEFNLTKKSEFYGDKEENIFDGDIDTTPAFPIIVSYSIEFDSNNCSINSFDDCYLIQTGNHGCYIAEINSTGAQEQ